MHRRTLIAVVLAGCGGKILDESLTSAASSGPVAHAPSLSPPTAPTAPTGATSEPAAPSLPAPASSGTRDACTMLCERDARCPTTIPAIPSAAHDADDCIPRCEKLMNADCDAEAWLLCFAGHLDPNACTKLPDDCRPSYCAWATCAKQPVGWCS